MPKKTREAKMAAQLRRMKEQLVMRQAASAPTPTPPKATGPTKQESLTTSGFSIRSLEQKSAATVQPIKELGQRYDYSYLARDLRKIAVLAIAAVALEIVLNLTTRASFAKLILRSFGLEI